MKIGLTIFVVMLVLFALTGCYFSSGSSPTTTTKSKIAFMSHRDGNYDIYIMNVDGSGQTRLTNNPANDYYPSFLP
ncbi:MAG: hypothetical protein L6305_00935 [Actinomycetia bacterium]|nr:hypothetical protein [Actinomycetes bacterium]